MADKYIKASTLLGSGRDFLAGVLFIEKGRRSGKTQAVMEEMLRHVIRSAPAEDVVPVVRCKACAKRKQEDMFYKCAPCGYKCNEGDFYCAEGVVKEGQA